MLAVIGLLGSADTAAGVFKVHALDATFEIVPNLEGELKDLAVKLIVTVEPPVDSSGSNQRTVFTHRAPMGHDPIRNVNVSLPDGTPVHFSEDHGDQGALIQWRFKMVELTQITAVVRFTIVDAVRGNLETNHIDLPWLQDWCSERCRLTTRFILPADHPLTRLDLEPGAYQQVTYRGKPAMQRVTDEPGQRTFEVHFSPGLVSGKLYVSDKESWILVGSLAGIGLGLAAGLGLIYRLTRKRRR